MTNEEIRSAILKINYIKSLQLEADSLRKRIHSEMKKRGKIKINLGGPMNEDYICRKISGRTDFIEQSDIFKLTYKISTDSFNQIRGIDL